jgi:hypothetical protein
MGVPVLALAFTAVGLLTIGLPIWLQHRRHLLETRDPCTPHMEKPSWSVCCRAT